jgi:hypothetical protein
MIISMLKYEKVIVDLRMVVVVVVVLVVVWWWW